MYRTNDKDIWRVFREHHYLSAEMNKASDVFTIYWDDTLIGLCAVLPQPSGNFKYGRRATRLVILPDYQNLGIGTKLIEFIAEYYITNGYKFFIRSTHLRLKEHCEKSPLWQGTSHNGKVSDYNENVQNINFGKKDKSVKRIAYAYEYMGQDYINKPKFYLYIDNTDKIDYNILKSNLITLKKRLWLCIVTGASLIPSPIEDICLELGIRTQLLYTTKKGVSKIVSKYKNKNIVTKWDKDTVYETLKDINCK